MEFKEKVPRGAGGPPGIGEVLRRTRIAQGLSLFALAHDLNLSVAILEAVEEEAWRRLPAGRERPCVRQIAEHLGVDLGTFSAEQWNQLPGALDHQAPSSRQEFLERVLVGAIAVGSVALLLWLVVPGRSLKRAGLRVLGGGDMDTSPAPWVPKAPAGPYPVVGEVLPEVPVNSEGVLISMRAMDTCQAVIQGPAVGAIQGATPAPAPGTGAAPLPGATGPTLAHTLRVSDPWRLRVKGPFTIALDNAGVVMLEVAGRHIRHGRTVGEAWSGRFGANGEWLVPAEKAPAEPASAPEADAGDATAPEGE